MHLIGAERYAVISTKKDTNTVETLEKTYPDHDRVHQLRRRFSERARGRRADEALGLRPEFAKFQLDLRRAT